MTRRSIVAVVLAFGLMLGTMVALHAAYPPGRCACETMGWGVWDWEYWYFECHTPRPPEWDPV